MKIHSTLLVASLLGAAAATPQPEAQDAAGLEDRSALQARGTFCDDWGRERRGSYEVFNNLWGKRDATSGNQCTTVSGRNGNSIVWGSTWTWWGNPMKVKSYPNAVVDSQPKPLSAVGSIPSTWKWTYSGDRLIANVAYDVFTSDTPTSDFKFELMVWLGQIGGAGPISATYGADGKPTIWQMASIRGRNWKVYKGKHNQMTVYSFLPPQEIRDYSGNIKDFFNFLTRRGEIADSQILRSVGAGTEPFEGGNARFQTLGYTASVN